MHTQITNPKCAHTHTCTSKDAHTHTHPLSSKLKGLISSWSFSWASASLILMLAATSVHTHSRRVLHMFVHSRLQGTPREQPCELWVWCRTSACFSHGTLMPIAHSHPYATAPGTCFGLHQSMHGFKHTHSNHGTVMPSHAEDAYPHSPASSHKPRQCSKR